MPVRDRLAGALVLFLVGGCGRAPDTADPEPSPTSDTETRDSAAPVDTAGEGDTGTTDTATGPVTGLCGPPQTTAITVFGDERGDYAGRVDAADIASTMHVVVDSF